MGVLKTWGDLLAPSGGYHSGQLWQVAVVALLLFATAAVFRTRLDEAGLKRYGPLVWIRHNFSFIVFWVLVLVAQGLAAAAGQDSGVFRFFAYLGGLWLAIGILCSFLRERFWVASLALVLYLTTGIFGLGLVDDGIAFLDGLRLTIGSFSITAWGVLAGIVAFALTLWVSLALARLIETRLDKVPNLSASLQVLIIKIIRIVFITVAVVVAISSMGADLTALTVFGGAIGLGLGFGFQKVISNLVSGIILLIDRSIKPGDVIEIEGTYGWINNLRARYASVITRDGTEHLIPNEDLITQKVINWSFTNDLVRIRTPIGISYKSDPHEAIRVVEAAAASLPRVLEQPGPLCLLTGFGDSSVDLELRFWIKDPSNGVGNVRSAVLLKVWDAFKENGIEIPFPQRDVHIRSTEVIPVQRKDPDPE